MQFEVHALKGNGSILSLTVEAANALEAGTHATGDGMQVLSVRAKQRFRLRGAASSRFPLLLFSQELLALLDAGINLVEAIETLAEKEQRPGTRKVLDDVLMRLREGLALSQAVQQTPAAFPPLFCATVQASERTGGLAEALGRYVVYQTQLEVVRKKLVSAAIYPALLLAVGTT